ncbi:hypothetical protein DICSQDRAFT_167154 [Dichomitus squalens LYAD-421 SS1]|uniref:uncharacterized protein n=1 Tax=Dichomitus squalens (strain LYAD-421) TaxID=732165 RepID=UPI000441572E|nr:uncharacterized protein DICSQDRAFT_167154 [Dichomitus squalens LYAD-421 SS1]EJF63989.1 hypothetical protein DICSQDRAFT_167154 [Dichomitus squalens LYAD-421 SS1]
MHPKAVVCQDVEVKGDITIGAAGPIVIGSGCIIERATATDGTMCSARSLSSSSSSDITEPISPQPQQCFSGMTFPIAEILANNVFCLLDNHKDDRKRISARAFGNWIKDLPNLLGDPWTYSQHLYCLCAGPSPSIPYSCRHLFGTLSSLGRGPAFEHKHGSPITLSPVPDGETEQGGAMDFLHDHHNQHDAEAEMEGKSDARTSLSSIGPRDPPHFAILGHHANARHSRRSSSTVFCFSWYGIAANRSSIPPSLTSLGSSTGWISKKTSKWKLSFGKNNANATAGATSLLAAEDGPSLPDVPSSGGKQMSVIASNVTNLLISLNAPPAPSAASPHAILPSETATATANSGLGEDDGMRMGSLLRLSVLVVASSRKSERRYSGPNGNTEDKRSEHGISPSSTRSGRPLASSASSMASSNWGSLEGARSATNGFLVLR